jgi:hypothetical protein
MSLLSFTEFMDILLTWLFIYLDERKRAKKPVPASIENLD